MKGRVNGRVLRLCDQSNQMIKKVEKWNKIAAVMQVILLHEYYILHTKYV